MAAVADFARKLDAVLRTFNLSRGKLAQTVGIDKSVVSRWASGATMPTDHNLSLLTQAVARHKPDFARLDWDLDAAVFADRLRREATAVASADSPTPPRDRPSIVVLPFDSFDTDPAQAYFADGITEDVITALSKWRNFLVIARNSAFTYKGRSVDVRQVGRELGVRYVVQGSVRRAGNRVRVGAQLIDAGTAAHVWAERYDGRLDDVFALQDSLCASIVAALQPELAAAELQRIRQKRPETFDAYDFYLQALTQYYRHDREAADSARSLLEQALVHDPAYAVAHGLLACCHYKRRQQGWYTSFADEQRDGLAAAERALALAPEDPTVLRMASMVVTALAQDRDRGRALIDRSLALNPNCAQAWSVSGWNHFYSGDGQRAIDDLQRALRLSPVDPLAHSIHAGVAAGHMILRQFEPMYEAARTSLREGSRYTSNLRFFAAACAYTGRKEEAADALRRLLALEPGLTVAAVAESRSNQAVAIAGKLLHDGLRLAGLPER